MKKFGIFVSIMSLFASCSSPQSEKTENRDNNYEIVINKENFKEMVSYIEYHGKVSPERGVACDYEYIFYDSEKNKHRFITIKRDSLGSPSIEGSVKQISVWSYPSEQNGSNLLFCYLITEEGIKPSVGFDSYEKTNKKTIYFACRDFLEKINTVKAIPATHL